MKFFLTLITTIFLISATEKAATKTDTLILIHCDTVKVVRVIKDTSIIITQDTLKTENPKPEKKKKK